MPGFRLEVLDDEGKPIPAGRTGNICLKLPLPPGRLPTPWQDPEGFRKSHLDAFPGYYHTADGGFIDEDGHVFVMGRTDDQLKGQVPIGLVVLKDGVETPVDALEAEAVQLIRREVGAIAAFRKAIVVKRLPKTRSGKILRKTIRRLAHEEQIVTPPTIDDPSIVAEIRTALREHRVGQYANLPLGEDDTEGM